MKVLGEDHPDTKIIALFISLKVYSDAEPLYVRALKAGEHYLEDHPDTLRSVNNLGSLYSAQGKYSDAEPLRTALIRCTSPRTDSRSDYPLNLYRCRKFTCNHVKR